MPLPKPRKNEKEDDFISRCIPLVIAEDTPQEQATAICYSQWKDSKKNEDYEPDEIFPFPTVFPK